MKREWKTEVVKLSDMVPMEDNPRKIDAPAARALNASMNRFGMVELIVWNKRTGHIVSGHQRYSILKSHGVEEVPVIVVDMGETEERSASITMNNFEIEGEYSNPVVELLDSVKDADSDLYASLRMENLRDDVSDLLEKSDNKDSDIDEKISRSLDEEEWDTECPCCGHRWKIGPDDISLMSDSDKRE